MKIITVRQPWAYLIVSGRKNIENRKWRTHYRGPVLIHAAKAPNAAECEQKGFDPNELERGCVVGVANLVDCVDEHRSRWFEGPYGFVLHDRRAIKPIPWTGALGLIQAPPALLRKLPAGIRRVYAA